MKISGSFMLLLLLGSVSAQDITQCRLTSPPDIYAALRDLTASLVQLKANIATDRAQLWAEVDKLKQQKPVLPVAFSASLTVEGELFFGPVTLDTPLIYRYVPTNIGNAFNPSTGAFTAPVRGAYHFEFHINGHTGRSTAAWLVKNSQNIFAAHESQSDGFMSSSNGASLLLEAGDKVFVRLAATSQVFDNYNHHSTFSGHLLFPM
ncbi:complement C1q-like protein 2 [Etheostoma spectabile]|uniref:complement C1q-like protein 2 n=1 Tax=Etheostoma spectabile TaxID=54343 RepID=UPI0013AF7B4F|nr:complement C1q-like protein 2 [Etheostoma spectabile]